eukprot:gene7563-7066_t
MIVRTVDVGAHDTAHHLNNLALNSCYRVSLRLMGAGEE